LEPTHIDVRRPATASCPHCGASLATEAVDDGTTIVCAACRQSFVLRPAADSRRYSRKALASLVLGICSIIFWCAAGIPAIILGVLALIDIRRHEDQLKGRQAAIAGIIVGCSLGVICFPVLLGLLMPALEALWHAK
jgi:uncharacterized paraquat-inducible protein A